MYTCIWEGEMLNLSKNLFVIKLCILTLISKQIISEWFISVLL